MADHLQFFGLASEPFESGGERVLVLETGPLRRAVAWTRTELAVGESILCVRGASGAGKSRLAAALPYVLDQRVAVIPDPTVSWEEIGAAIIEQLEIGGSCMSLEALRSALGAESQRPVIVVDRAESVSKKGFQRFEALQRPADEEGSPLVALLFLADEQRLTPQVRGVPTSCRLAPLQPREIRRYVEARMLNAGFEGDEVFPPATCRGIYQATGGIPSGVDLLCTTLLVEAARCGARTVEPELVAESCSDGDADEDLPVLSKPAQAGPRPRFQTPVAGPLPASEAHPPVDSHAVGMTDMGPGLLEEPDARGRNDQDLEFPAARDSAAAAEEDQLADLDEVKNLDEQPAIPPFDTGPGEEAVLLPKASGQGNGELWRRWSRSASSAEPSLVSALLAAMVVAFGAVVVFIAMPDSVPPATRLEARSPALSQPREAAEQPKLSAALEAIEGVAPSGPSEAPIEWARVTGDSEANAAVVANASEPSELADVPADVSEASEPQLAKVVLDRPAGASESLEPEAPAAVAETSGPPAARARIEPSVSEPDPVERPSSEVSKSPPRSVAASLPALVWPESFLAAQRRDPPTQGRPARLEIPEPELADLSRRKR